MKFIFKHTGIKKQFRRKITLFIELIFMCIQDLDTYKQITKDELTEWTSALKRKNIPDWLIIVVSSDESKLKTKLLPRSSVFDKIKSDFCNKQPERSVQYIE